MTYKREWEILSKTIESIDPTSFDKFLYSIDLHALLIAGEDHRFMKHQGVDFVALCRAAWRTFFCDKREGGSTIAMQLVRVLTDKYEKTISRKILEIYLARQVTKYIPKNKIIALYLSVAYFGCRMNGIKQAISQLGLDPNHLSLYDSAGLIARLKYPEPLNVSKKRKRMIEVRTNYILSRYEKFNLGIHYGNI